MSQNQLELVNKITESKFWTGDRQDTLALLAEFTGTPFAKKKTSGLKKVKDKGQTASKPAKKMGIEGKTMTELKEMCRESKITGFSKLKRTELVELVKKHLAESKPVIVPPKVLDEVVPEAASAAPVPSRERCNSDISDKDDVHEPDSEDEDLADSGIPAKMNESLWEDNLLGEDETEDYSTSTQAASTIKSNLVAEGYD